MTPLQRRPLGRALIAAVGTAVLATGGCSAQPQEPSAAAKGDTIEYGAYEQDGDASNGAEPIRWTVLDRIDDRLLILAEDVLAARPYDADSFQAATWADSDLRAWLGSDFLNSAFSASQREGIIATDLDNADSRASGVDGGADTTDMVFVLSETEYGIYLADVENREYTAPAPASRACADAGLYLDADGRTDWWLRSPGTYPYTAQYIQPDGAAFTGGSNVDATLGVRPAMWITAGEG